MYCVVPEMLIQMLTFFVLGVCYKNFTHFTPTRYLRSFFRGIFALLKEILSLGRNRSDLRLLEKGGLSLRSYVFYFPVI